MPRKQKTMTPLRKKKPPQARLKGSEAAKVDGRTFDLGQVVLGVAVGIGAI